jgi:hypothetical protein
VDDDAARALAPALGKVNAAIQTLDDDAIREPWTQALRQVADLDGANGLLVGRAVRLLRDGGAFDTEDVAARMSRALSRGTEPASAAGWLEGFLAGSGLVLAHDRTLLQLIDQWLTGLDAERFEHVLPLLRRTFATFTGPERRTIGDRLPHLAAPNRASAEASGSAVPTGLSADWVAAALPTVHLLLTGRAVSDDTASDNTAFDDTASDNTAFDRDTLELA